MKTLRLLARINKDLLVKRTIAAFIISIVLTFVTGLRFVCMIDASELIDFRINYQVITTISGYLSIIYTGFYIVALIIVSIIDKDRGRDLIITDDMFDLYIEHKKITVVKNKKEKFIRACVKVIWRIMTMLSFAFISTLSLICLINSISFVSYNVCVIPIISDEIFCIIAAYITIICIAYYCMVDYYDLNYARKTSLPVDLNKESISNITFKDLVDMEDVHNLSSSICNCIDGDMWKITEALVSDLILLLMNENISKGEKVVNALLNRLTSIENVNNLDKLFCSEDKTIKKKIVIKDLVLDKRKNLGKVHVHPQRSLTYFSDYYGNVMNDVYTGLIGLLMTFTVS